jgi:hypothetical protein
MGYPARSAVRRPGPPPEGAAAGALGRTPPETPTWGGVGEQAGTIRTGEIKMLQNILLSLSESEPLLPPRRRKQAGTWRVYVRRRQAAEFLRQAGLHMKLQIRSKRASLGDTQCVLGTYVTMYITKERDRSIAQVRTSASTLLAHHIC